MSIYNISVLMQDSLTLLYANNKGAEKLVPQLSLISVFEYSLSRKYNDSI